MQRLKAENVTFGTRRIAGFLVQLGLKGSRASVQRILRQKPPRRRPAPKAEPEGRPLTADGPNKVWMIDITKIELRCFFTVRIAAVIDLFSRKIMAIGAWEDAPTALDMRDLVSRAIRDHGRKPRHLITDHGGQFTARLFTRFLVRRGIKRRYGAVASSLSVSVIERFWLTLKTECHDGLRPWKPIEIVRANARRYVEWYNRFRPHWSFGGLTPDEVHRGRRCCRRRARTDGLVTLSFFEGDRSLPIYRYRKAA